MDITKKLAELFNEGLSGKNSKSFGVTDENRELLFKEKDAKRKREERAKAKRIEAMKKGNTNSVKNGGPIINHPRNFLVKSPLKLTLIETFIKELIEYLNTDKKRHIREAVSLMNEYPNLKKYVLEKSHNSFPKNPLHVYFITEHLDEEVDQIVEHSDCLKIGHLSEAECKLHEHKHDSHFISEVQISPDKILIYIPAFTKEMEELIYSGKIEESEINVLRKARQHNQLVLPPSINESRVIRIS